MTNDFTPCQCYLCKYKCIATIECHCVRDEKFIQYFWFGRHNLLLNVHISYLPLFAHPLPWRLWNIVRKELLLYIYVMCICSLWKNIHDVSIFVFRIHHFFLWNHIRNWIHEITKYRMINNIYKCNIYYVVFFRLLVNW